MALVTLFTVGQQFVGQRAIIGQPILPLAFAFLAQRRVEAGVTAMAHAPVHRDNFVFIHAQRGGDMFDLFGAQVAILHRADLALQAAQVEEQLLLGRRRADLYQAPAAQDIFLDRRLDPPHGIGGEAEAFFGIEFAHALHQADIAFGN